MPLTHFSNTRGGIEKSGNEESKEPRGRPNRKLNINVQVPTQHKSSYDDQSEARNDLFNPSNPDKIIFKFKQDIMGNGLKVKNDFPECLKFIKALSANKNFEYALKEL